MHQFVVNYEDPYVYRFFDQESHADDFLRGDILVTTLNKCRDHEDPTRRDAREATETYHTGVVRGHTTSNPAIGRIAEHLGVVRRDYATRVDLTGNVLEHTAPDAHLLCASDRSVATRWPNSGGSASRSPDEEILRAP